MATSSSASSGPQPDHTAEPPKAPTGEARRAALDAVIATMVAVIHKLADEPTLGLASLDNQLQARLAVLMPPPPPPPEPKAEEEDKAPTPAPSSGARR